MVIEPNTKRHNCCRGIGIDHGSPTCRPGFKSRTHEALNPNASFIFVYIYILFQIQMNSKIGSIYFIETTEHNIIYFVPMVNYNIVRIMEMNTEIHIYAAH